MRRLTARLRGCARQEAKPLLSGYVRCVCVCRWLGRSLYAPYNKFTALSSPRRSGPQLSLIRTHAGRSPIMYARFIIASLLGSLGIVAVVHLWQHLRAEPAPSFEFGSTVSVVSIRAASGKYLEVSSEDGIVRATATSPDSNACLLYTSPSPRD